MEHFFKKFSPLFHIQNWSNLWKKSQIFFHSRFWPILWKVSHRLCSDRVLILFQKSISLTLVSTGFDGFWEKFFSLFLPSRVNLYFWKNASKLIKFQILAFFEAENLQNEICSILWKVSHSTFYNGC